MALVIEGQADFSQAQRSIDDFSKKSRIALTNLSLVVQDLPYGFIGIQNNLPALSQSFAQLSAEAGGSTNALKQLASGLAGPAGLFLAFSAVTSAVTFAVQKYGSLSNAINAVFSSNSKLIQVQQELNKELAKTTANTIQEESKLRILSKTMNDSLAPMRERQNAYIALKKIAPEIANGIGKENELTQKNIEIINQNIAKRLEYIKIRARESAILSVVNKNEEERIILEQEYPALLNKKNKAEIAYNRTRGLSFDATKTFNAGLDLEAIKLESATNALNKNAAQRRNLYKINNDLLSQLEPLVNQSSQYDAETQRFTESLKKGTKAVDLYKIGIQGIIEALKERDKLIKANTEANQRAIEFNVDTQFKKIAEQTKKANLEQAKYKKGIEGIISALQQRDSLQMKDPFAVDPLAGFDKVVENLDAQTYALKAVELFRNNFTQPLTDLFNNFFETGEMAFKDFGKTILAVIRQIVSQAIASGIIKLLANIFLGVPFGGFTSAKQGVSAFQGFFGSLFGDLLGGGGVSAPSFAGIGGGSFGMSGQVNLVLRGQDLVGSLNRTNTLINRVG